jgi:hypothetical protein
MLLAALSMPEAAEAAAIAIRDLCECCGAQLQPCLQQLLQLYKQVLEAGAAHRAAAAAAAAAGIAGQGLGGALMTPAQRHSAGLVVASMGNAAAAAAGQGGLHEDDVQNVIRGVVTCVVR